MKKFVIWSLIMGLLMAASLLIGCKTDSSEEKDDGLVIAEQYRGDFGVENSITRFTINKMILIYTGIDGSTYNETIKAWTVGNELYGMVRRSAMANTPYYATGDSTLQEYKIGYFEDVDTLIQKDFEALGTFTIKRIQ